MMGAPQTDELELLRPVKGPTRFTGAAVVVRPCVAIAS
jgi:hypothetical protein